MIGIAKTLSKLTSQELDDILDSRDSDSFDRAWCELRALVPENESQHNLKTFFKSLSKATNSHEICSYIVEDIQLIENANFIGIESEFLNYLHYTYTQLQVPCKWKN